MTNHPIKFISQDDASFPPLLRQISDPPEGLYVRGTLKDVPAISVVGTRRLTTYGRRATQAIVQELASGGCAIVSGLALGIDGEAHKAALDAGAYTIAVLATGIDDATLYPREHVKLAHRILEAGGALISENPPGSPSFKFAFPRRNRLIAGMTAATVVVEASLNSGSLITARLALDENREVLAVPGPIWSRASEGCHALLKLGAKPCTSAEDVIRALKLDRPELMAEARAALPLTEEESRLLSLLTEPLHIDQLSLQSARPAAEIGSSLSLLELKGYVQHLGGQIWLKKGVLAKLNPK
ncbi:DNA-protecting protein DprA [Candidatus Uhrbacteria bacterium]|nr:MAG: DNA-protecting protein DprA [Candidatus Uhrbacteria bacterium]